MRSVIYLLVISVLALSGCNPGIESTEKEIASQKRVRISLGQQASNRINRYKGTYENVVNGGSVQLFYSFEGSEEEEALMELAGSGWTVSLSLKVGSYTFRAEAYDAPLGHGEVIFETTSPKTFTITPQTTSLNLGLQLHPVLKESVANTPMPTIHAITKPPGYEPNNDLEIHFAVSGGVDDQLTFKLSVYEDNSTELGSVELSSDDPTLHSEVDGSIRNYSTDQSPMAIFIPEGTGGALTVDFSVYSETLEASKHAQFTLQGPVNVTTDDDAITFTPQATIAWLEEEVAETNTIGYRLTLSGNEGFTDEITFAFDDPTQGYTSEIVENPDGTDNATTRSGTLTRSELEAGTLTITFTSQNGETSSESFEVTAGTTEFFTCPPDCPQEGGSGSGPVATLSGINGANVDLHYWDYFGFAPQGTHDLTTDGSAIFELTAWDGVGEGSYDIVITDGTGNIVWESNPDNEKELFYLPAGTYTIEFTAVGTIDDGRADIFAEAVHVLEDNDGNMVAANQGIDEGITFLASGETDIRNIYFNNQAGKLVIVQDINSDKLSLSLLDAEGTPVNDNNGQPIASETGELFVGSTHDFYLQSGDYQVQIQNNTGADWNGRLVAYQAYDTGVKVTTPDGINYYTHDYVDMLDLSFQAESSSDSVFVVDVSQQCTEGQVVRVYSGDPQDLAGISISSTDDYGNTIVTSADCSEPFQMVVTAGDYLSFSLRWPRVVVDTGAYAWEYDDPRGNPVYEGQYSAIEIHWSNDTDISSEETMTVMNINPDIELGYEDNSIDGGIHWVGGATEIPAINLTRGDRSEWIYIRYIGTEDIEMTEQRTIQVLFAEPNGNPSYESAGITFEVRDND